MYNHHIMTSTNSITITDPQIVEFFKKNTLFTCESFILHHMEQFSNKQTNKIEISMDELYQIYQTYQTIMSCKNNLDKIAKTCYKDIRNVNYHIKSKPLENMFEQHLNIKQELFICDNCEFSCSTRKGLVTHKRKCKTKLSDNGELEDLDDDEIDT